MDTKRPGSDSGKLDFPSTTEAHHNDDGLFVMTDPEPGKTPEGGFVENEAGTLYVPAPKEFKQFRFFTTEKGLRVEAAETAEQIRELVFAARATDAELWYKLTEPVFGNEVWVSAETLATVAVIAEDFKDMEQIRDQYAAYFKQKSLAKLNAAQQSNQEQENNRRLMQKLNKGNGRN